jgi:hypothetical protein
MTYLFEAGVYWIYDHELELKTGLNQIAAQFSGVPPIHEHSGNLILTEQALQIEGDVDLHLRLSDIVQLYLGFDEQYQRNFIKNLGAFCQPLRITANGGSEESCIYLIAGYNSSFCTPTQQLFTLLQDLLS